LEGTKQPKIRGLAQDLPVSGFTVNRLKVLFFRRLAFAMSCSASLE
jgi:hypothetical protein